MFGVNVAYGGVRSNDAGVGGGPRPSDGRAQKAAAHPATAAGPLRPAAAGTQLTFHTHQPTLNFMILL